MFWAKPVREEHASCHDDRDLEAFLNAIAPDQAGSDAPQRNGQTTRWHARVGGIFIALLLCLVATIDAGGIRVMLMGR